MSNTIQATFGLDINPLRAAAGKAQSIMKGVGDGMKSFIATPAAQVGAVLGSFFAYETFKSGIMGVVESGAQMVKLRAITGMTIGSLAMLKSLALETDTDFDSLAVSVNKMQRNLFTANKSGGPMIATLKMLGMDIADLNGLKPEEQFQKIGAAIAGLPTPMQRTATSMAIFGRSGVQMLPLFEQIGDVNFGNLSEKAKLLEKDAEVFRRITINFRKVSAGLKSRFIGMADQLAPVLLAVSTLLNSTNTLKFGQTLGKAMLDATEVFIGIWKNPAVLVDAFIALLQSGVASGMNTVVNGMIKAGVIFWEGMKLGVRAVLALDSYLTSAAYKFTGVVLDGMGDVNSYVNAGLVFAFENALEFFDGGWRTVLGNIQTGLVGAFNVAVSALKSGMDSIWNGAKAFWQQILSAIAKVPGLAKDAKDALLNAFTKKTEAEAPKSVAAPSGPFKARDFNTVLGSMKNSDYFKFAGAKLESLGDAGMKNAFTGMGDELKQFQDNAKALFNHVGTDFFGASEYKKNAEDAMAALKAVGEEVLAPFAIKPPEDAKNPRGLLSYAHDGLVSAGGLSTGNKGLMNAAYGQSNLLTAKERASIMDAAVARGGARAATTAGAFNAIRNGDHKRQREFEREKARKSEGIEQGNDLLGGILKQVTYFNG